MKKHLSNVVFSFINKYYIAVQLALHFKIDILRMKFYHHIERPIHVLFNKPFHVIATGNMHIGADLLSEKRGVRLPVNVKKIFLRWLK